MAANSPITVQEADRRLAPIAHAYSADARWLRIRTQDYFGMLDFTGKRVLDVGAGKGLYACCVAALNAECVVALEPEFAGSRNTAITIFRERIEWLGLRNIEFHPVALEAYTAPPASFDLICMIAVINHLDETHVQTLHADERSRLVYRSILQPVYDWLKPGGMLVISDVPPTHPYMPLVKIGLLKRHPFQPSIEWHKHQHPAVWKQLLESIGFTDVRYHWATNWRYPWIPRFLVDNPLTAQLYSSQFVLRAMKR
jgi:2-polyprenyl-3-methyl-5-hydroxy-6-metoxy-1,4-benzoquinol methylase